MHERFIQKNKIIIAKRFIGNNKYIICERFKRRNKNNYIERSIHINKYINIYSSSIFTGTNSTNNSLCTLATCGGQALYETKGWYHDSSYFVISSTPWFRRGGSYNAGTGAGIFNSNSYSGTNNVLYGFRVALAQIGT